MKEEIVKPLYRQLEKLEEVLCHKRKLCNGCPMLDYSRLKNNDRYCLLEFFKKIVADIIDEEE